LGAAYRIISDEYQRLSGFQVRHRRHDERYVYPDSIETIDPIRHPGVLLYPSKMLYPAVLPLLSIFDALYVGGMTARKKLRLFYIVFSM